MLLALDCGNTHMVIGLFEGEQLKYSWRLSSEDKKTEDEYMVLLRTLMEAHSLDIAAIDGMIVASVVPSVNFNLRKLAEKHLHIEPIFVNYRTKSGLKIDMENPAEVGADRIVNAIAAHHIYGGTLIVVDFGTATTFDCVLEDARYIGGAICPGIEISQRALFTYASQLSSIAMVKPPSVIGRNTAQALRSGMQWGYGGQVDALVRRMSLELPSQPQVIATGGLAQTIAGFSDSIDHVDVDLTLKGLQMIYAINN
ncbi:MAG: type III pantothenate kinase [Bacillota bacterium]|nr:type III pantothenate kinase [Bacillota bacterium]